MKYGLIILLFLSSLSLEAQKNKTNHLFYYSMAYKGSLGSHEQLEGQANFLLSLQDSISVFSNVRNIHRDSIIHNWKMQPSATQGTLSMAGVPNTPFNYYIEKQKAQDRLITFDRIGGKNFYYEEKFPAKNWQLGSQTKIIEGFKCYDAKINVYGRNFIAWYTPEIPFSEGPYKFYGLPGLIVEIYDIENIYTFRLAGFNPNDDRYISVPDFRKYKIKKTDKTTFFKAKESYQENIAEIAKSMGVQVSEEQMKKIRESKTEDSSH